MKVYPHTNAIILTDDLFVQYGGHTGSSTPAQRQIAYQIGEQLSSEDISTLLLPTIVTGTYDYTQYVPIITDYAYVQRVLVVRFLDTKEEVYFAQTGTANVNVSLRNDARGIIDIHYLVGNCACHSAAIPYPYQIQVMYEAGLPTGTASQPNVLLALTTMADITLNEIIGYGNEAPGDIGVQSFSNQQYRETRIGLIRTTLGSSARAQFASKQLTSLRKLRYVGL